MKGWCWRLPCVALLALSLGPPAFGQQAAEEEPKKAPEAAGPDGVKLDFSGHLRPIAVWESIDFGELGPPPRNRFTAVGARTKLRIEGKLQDKARFFSSFILDFSEVEQGPYTASQDSEIGQLRMLNSYVELFGSNTLWRAGSQIQYWGNFPGYEKPTDRLNPKDLAYKSRELEDQKLPETALEFIVNPSGQALSLMYIPVPKVNRLHPNTIGFLNSLGYEQVDNPRVRSNDSKYVARLYGDLGNLNYALSYIDGVNPRPDLANDGYGEPNSTNASGGYIPPERRVEPALDGQAVYHRYRTPAIDLLYTVGDAKWILGVVAYDTADTANASDPLKQNDWYEWLGGFEYQTGVGLWDFFAGQKIVPHVRDIKHPPADPADPDNAARRRVYLQGLLLDQPRERTNDVGLKYRNLFVGNRLEFILDLFWYANAGGEQVRAYARPDVAWYFDDAHTIAARVRPAYIQNQEIVTQEIMAEVQMDF